MKKISLLIVIALLVGTLTTVCAEGATYSQSPLLDAAVQSGELPDVADRLPENPKLVHEILDEYIDLEIGDYGGTLRFVTSVVNWDSDVFIGTNEPLLTMSSTNSGEILPNIVEAFSANDEQTEFTFTLRKGLKWSDGVEVTMEDFKFAIENVAFNETLNPVVPASMRTGNSMAGNPFTFEAIDDMTFKVSFDAPYGGYLVYISAAGWVGYTDLLKPAHYLKQFHKDFAETCHGSLEAYYEFIQPFATVLGYDDATAENVWVYVFNSIDLTNWELTNPMEALTATTYAGLIETNFPVLYPWMMQDSSNGVTTWVRNPYYFKVDASGKQLPYIDYVTSTMVEDMEMIQMEAMAGHVDFMRESAGINNISLYRENEEAANVYAYVTASHMNPLSLYINMTFGLNTDGTVKDDDVSKAWQEVVVNPNFRKALEYAVDAEEILEAVYLGFGEINPRQQCTGDFEAANALLDEMGMLDIDGDGYRETPSGLPFNVQIYNAAETGEMIDNGELIVEFYRQIGLKFVFNAIDDTLLSTRGSANEIPVRLYWNGCESLWFEAGWYRGEWGRLWSVWYDNGGLNDPAVEGLKPPQEVEDFYRLQSTMFQVSPDIGATEVYNAVADFTMQNDYIICPLTNVQQCVLINADIGNVPTGGIDIGWNYAIEQLFFRADAE